MPESGKRILLAGLLLALSMFGAQGAATDQDLIDAVAAGDVGKAKSIIEANPELARARTKDGQTPLHLAARKGQLDLVDQLIKSGADLDATDSSGQTAETVAAQAGHQEIVELLAPRVGDLGELDRLSFEGVKSFSPAALKTGLRASADFFLVSHPLAFREEYLKTLERKLVLGFQHQGFPDVRIAARYEAGPAGIVVKVEEGPRFLCGPVVVICGSNLSSSAIIDRMANTNEPATADQGAFEFVDQPASTNRWGNRPKSEQPIFWAQGQSAHFSDYDLQALAAIAKDALRMQGFFFSSLELQPVRDPTNGTAQLLVRVVQEGPRAVIDHIEFTGNQKNSSEALLNYLQLKPGMALSGTLIAEVEERLWRAGRFISAAINLGEPDENGRVGLQIKLIECELAPPIDQPFSRLEQTFLKTREWIAKLGHGNEDMVLTISGVKGLSSTYDLIFSPQLGFALLGADAAPATNARSPFGLVVRPGLAAFYPPASSRKLAVAYTEHQFLINLGIEERPDNAKEAPFDITLAAGFNAKAEPQTGPYRLRLALPPVACIHLAHKTNTLFWFEGGLLIGSNDTTVIQFDAATGKLLGFTAKGEDSARFKLRFEPGAFATAAHNVEARGADLPNAYDTNAPFSSVFACLFDEALSSKFAQSILCAHAHLSPDTWQKSVAVIRRTKLATALAPLAQLEGQSQRDGEAEAEFVVPEDPALPPSSINRIFSAVSAWLIDHSDQAFARHSWPWKLMRESGFVLLGKGKYTGQVLEGFYESKETGPLGCLAIASLLDYLQPDLARKFAARGLERLSLEGLRHDCRVFLEGDAVVAQCGARLAAALRDLDDESVSFLAGLQTPAAGEFLRESARRLREARDKPVLEAIGPALAQYWDKDLRQRFAAALKDLSLEPREAGIKKAREAREEVRAKEDGH